MSILVTGSAGFIGYHVCETLLQHGETVIGVDNFCGDSNPALMLARTELLCKHPNFVSQQLDVSDISQLNGIPSEFDIVTVVHLAGQAGLRSSFEHPAVHVRDNYLAQFAVLEFCRTRQVRNLVHASTSAVYGRNDIVPMHEASSATDPSSIYAATKRGAELLSRTWSALHSFPVTSLRFFNVYGPWGRPDSAPWIFTESILNGTTIRLHGHGKMRRSFIYIDDLVKGILASCNRPPETDPQSGFRHAIYNLGTAGASTLQQVISALESAIGQPAICEMTEPKPGEMMVSESSIEKVTHDLDFAPSVPLECGLARFVDWYKQYHGF